MKNKRILLLFLISTLSQLPLSMIRFIVPIYAKDLGADTFILGMMGTAYGLVYILLASYFGKVSERFGNKSMMILGMVIYAMVVIIYPFIENPVYLVLVRGGEAVGMAMIWPSVEAFSQTVKEKNLEQSIMVYTLSWSIAASIAPYIGAVFIENFKMAIFMISVISILAAISASFIPKNNSNRISFVKNRFNTLFDIVIPIFIYGFNSAAIASFYPAFGSSSGLGILRTGIILTVSGAFLVLSFILSGTVLKKFDKRRITFSGIGLQLLFILIYLTDNFYVQLISLSLIFFGQGIVYFNVLLNIISSFSKNVRSKTGIFESSIGIGFILGPLLGSIPTAMGFQFPWLITFTVSLIIFLIYGMNLIK